MPYKVEHEWDEEAGTHRLSVNSGPGKPVVHGDWNGFKTPAIVEHEGQTFIWFSNYWAGYVDTEKIMELKEYPDNG